MSILKFVIRAVISFIIVATLNGWVTSTPVNTQTNLKTETFKQVEIYFDGRAYFSLVETFVEDIGKGSSWELPAIKTETKKRAVFSVNAVDISSGYVVTIVRENNPKMYYFFLIDPDRNNGGKNKVTGAIQVDMNNLYSLNGGFIIPCAFSEYGSYKFKNKKLSLVAYIGDKPVAFQLDPYNPSDIAKDSFRSNQVDIKLESPNSFNVSDLTRLELRAN